MKEKKLNIMASGKFRWISAAETCKIWDENFEEIHKFEEGSGPAYQLKYSVYCNNGSFLGNVLDVACNQDGSTLAFIKKANNQIFTATVGSQIFKSSTALTEVISVNVVFEVSNFVYTALCL